MTKLTVKQYKDINSKCKNGFVLDLSWFGVWKEKQLRKNIVIDDYTVIDIVVKFGKYFNGRWSDQVIAVQPEYRIDIMTRTNTDGMYRVHNLIEELAGEKVTRRNMNLLYEVEKNLTSDFILEKVREKLEKQPETYAAIFGAERIEKINNHVAA